MLDGPGRRNRFGARKAFEQERDAEEMIAMPVGDVDCCEFLVGDHGLDPGDEVFGLCGGDGSVDEDGGMLAMD